MSYLKAVWSLVYQLFYHFTKGIHIVCFFLFTISFNFISSFTKQKILYREPYIISLTKLAIVFSSIFDAWFLHNSLYIEFTSVRSFLVLIVSITYNIFSLNRENSLDSESLFSFKLMFTSLTFSYTRH